MGVKVEDTATALIDNTLHRSTRSALKTLRESGEKVRDLARKMVPRDEGNIEQAIESDDSKATGIHGRKIIEVYIDVDMPIPGRPGKRVGDYADWLHESNSYNLGKKSLEKAASNPGIIVGNKFLERAAEQLTPEIVEAIEKAVGKAV